MRGGREVEMGCKEERDHKHSAKLISSSTANINIVAEKKKVASGTSDTIFYL